MSPHKFRLDLSDAAKRDFTDILAYTLHQWGERQFIEYRKLLDVALNAIAQNPTSGRMSNRASVRIFSVGRHVIFYRIEKDIVYVVRILHDRMNVDLHLDE